MKKPFIFLLTIMVFCNCKEGTKIDTNYVIAKFQENADKINVVEYQVRRIDSTENKANISDNNGTAIIERDINDKIFGISFYGKRNDFDKEHIYDNSNGFTISRTKKSYEVEYEPFGFLGKPGGQMVYKNVFYLDSIYKNVSLKETENSYLLSFEFENDTVYNVTDRTKVYELDKSNFFPIQIKQSSKFLDNTSFSIAKFSNVKINENVTHSIKDLKLNFQDYSMIQQSKAEPNKLLSKKLPLLELTDLFDNNNIVSVNRSKLTLIDFWEVWCSPCIASFPKVENLKNKYSEELDVIGIVSEDKESAIKLIKTKGTTFQNLVGNDDLKEIFSVRGLPRYFLVDKNGIVQKDYWGFSEQIELDIIEFKDK